MEDFFNKKTFLTSRPFCVLKNIFKVFFQWHNLLLVQYPILLNYGRYSPKTFVVSLEPFLALQFKPVLLPCQLAQFCFPAHGTLCLALKANFESSEQHLLIVYFTTAVPLAVNSRTAFTFLPHSTTTTFFARSFAGSFPRFSDGQRGRRCLLPRLQPHHGHQQHRGLQVVLT